MHLIIGDCKIKIIIILEPILTFDSICDLFFSFDAKIAIIFHEIKKIQQPDYF